MAKVAKAVFPADLFKAMQEASPLNLEKAHALADQYDVKVKSIIAKAVREKIPYEKQVRVRKDGKPVASKEAVVGQIEHALEVSVGAFAGLEKASKASLEAVRDAIAFVVGESDEGDE